MKNKRFIGGQRGKFKLNNTVNFGKRVNTALNNKDIFNFINNINAL